MTGAENREQFRPADHPNDHFLLTTVVGSYPRPTWLARARELAEEGEFSADDLAEAHDDAAGLVAREHEEAGLDTVSDGEVRRDEMVEHVAANVDGFEFYGPVKVWDHNYIKKPSVVREVSGGDPWLVDEYAFARDVASRPVKVSITGPYTLARWSFDEVYDSDAALAADLADILNAEVRALAAAGARYVQFDEPALAAEPDDHPVVGECLDRLVADLPDEMRVSFHVCYGDYGRLQPAVNDFPIDEFDVELCNDDYEQLPTFEDPPLEPDLGLGVVDAHAARVESVAEIEANVRQGLRVVPPEKLTVSPDCGLKLLPRDVARGKLANLVTAARNVEAALDAGEIDLDDPAPAAD